MAINKKQLATILADLYTIDPDLKRFELELSRMVEEILVARPDTKFDSAFRARLRAELLAHATQLQGSVSETKGNIIINFFTMKKFVYAGGGALIAALIIIPAFTFLYQTGETPGLPGINQLIALSNDVEITPVGTSAFGSLAQQTTPGLGEMSAISARSGLGGGGTTPTQATTGMVNNTTIAPDIAVAQPQPGMPSAIGDKMVSNTMIAPDFVRYRYVYKGDALNLPSEAQDVFKRLTGLGSAPSASSLLSRISFGLVNLPSFNQSKVQNVTIAQDEPFGYVINANFEEGFVSIYENWPKWPQIICNDQTCIDRQRISIDQVPSDDELISIANEFIKNHGVNVTNYGEPEVDRSWKIAYDATPNKSEVWIPDALNVIYPLMINNQPVYEQGGMTKVGIMVNVNIRHKRVSSVYNLATQKYESSKYAVVSDSQKILDIAINGGLYNWYPTEGGKEIEVEIGTPSTILMRMYQYDQTTNRSNELLVPALLFPVTKPPVDQPYFYQRYITVPIIEEMLKDQGGPIRIMPFAEGGSVPTPPTKSTPGEAN